MEVREQKISNIREIFTHKFFSIPSYQRNYSWGTEEVEDFWGDILDVYNGYEDNHFFGQIVTFEDKNTQRQAIIDGQQRLITSSIFLAALKNTASKMKKDAKNNFKLLYPLQNIIETVDSLTGIDKEQIKMLLQDDDIRKCFQSILNNNNNILQNNKTNNKPEQSMQLVYKTFNENILSFINKRAGTDYPEKIKIVKDIFKSFCDKFELSTILASDSSDAFTIFETLNTRGKDLAPSDIIKTHLMSLSNKDKLNIFRKQWNKTSSALNNDSDNITKFIRTYWAAYNSLLPARKLYRSISKTITDEASAKSFLDNLSELVTMYNILKSPFNTKKEKDFFENNELTYLLITLRNMQVNIYLPLMLSMYHNKYNNSDIKSVIYKTISVYIRCHVICQSPTNNLEKQFALLAEMIWKNKFNNVQEIINKLEEFNNNNTEVNNAFKVLQKPGGTKGRSKWTLIYLLFNLYQYNNPLNMLMYDRKFNKEDFQLIKINSNIDKMFGNMNSNYNEYIGNWTIIEGSLFKEYRQSRFDDIKLIEILSRSDLNDNKQIADKISSEKWNINDVQNRQNNFSKNVIKIWH